MIVDITEFFEYIYMPRDTKHITCMYVHIHKCVCVYVIIDMQLDE